MTTVLVLLCFVTTSPPSIPLTPLPPHHHHIHSQTLYVVEHFSESFTFGMENDENDWSGEMEREIYKIKV